MQMLFSAIAACFSIPSIDSSGPWTSFDMETLKILSLITADIVENISIILFTTSILIFWPTKLEQFWVAKIVENSGFLEKNFKYAHLQVFLTALWPKFVTVRQTNMLFSKQNLSHFTASDGSVQS